MYSCQAWEGGRRRDVCSVSPMCEERLHACAMHAWPSQQKDKRQTVSDLLCMLWHAVTTLVPLKCGSLSMFKTKAYGLEGGETCGGSERRLRSVGWLIAAGERRDRQAHERKQHGWLMEGGRSGRAQKAASSVPSPPVSSPLFPLPTLPPPPHPTPASTTPTFTTHTPHTPPPPRFPTTAHHPTHTHTTPLHIHTTTPSPTPLPTLACARAHTCWAFQTRFLPQPAFSPHCVLSFWHSRGARHSAPLIISPRCFHG